MKVLQVVEWFSPHAGGVARHVRELSLFLSAYADVSILTSDPEAEGDVFRLPAVKDPLFKATITPGLPAILKKYVRDYDVVHVHHAFARLPLAAIKAAKTFNISVVLTNHTVSFMYDYEHLWRFLSYTYPRYRLTLSKVDSIISVSEAARRFISNFTANPGIVIPNGVDTDRFRPRSGIRLFDGDPVILYVGRLVPKKGVDNLILAMRNVLKVHRKARLIIVGKGALQKMLRSEAKLAGVESSVSFLGYVPDEELPYIYNSADVFVLPSITGESFGIVLLEAMASGLPVVATRVGGIPEVLSGQGVLVDPEPESIAEGIEEALGHPTTLPERFSWKNIAKRVYKVYREII